MLIAGVDEVGRGPLAGPVIAAAVILPDSFPREILRDSKLLSAKQRETCLVMIEAQAVAISIGRAEVAEIDVLNIHHASLLAMQRAILGLSIMPSKVLVDGKFCPNLTMPAEAIIKGDALIPEISAASIVAKVARDREMCAWDNTYPGYGFAKHSGYPTKAHMAALQMLGVSPIHRRSYAPVKALLM